VLHESHFSKTSARLTLAALVMVVALAGAVVFSATQRLRQELAKDETADALLHAVTSIGTLTLEYALSHEESVEAQWRSTHASLSKLLGNARTLSCGDERTLVDDLHHAHEGMVTLFGQLTRHRKSRVSSGTARVPDEVDDRLIAQIMNRIRAEVSIARRLSARSQTDLLNAQQRASMAVAAAGGILVLIVAGLIVFMRRGAKAYEKLDTEIEMRRRAEQRARDQAERLDLLGLITRTIRERQGLRSILQIVIGAAEEHLCLDFAFIGLRDHENNGLTVALIGERSAPLAAELALAEQARVEIDEDTLSRCLRGDVVYEPDTSQVPMPFPRRLAESGLGAIVLAPLLVESQVLGVLVAGRREPRSFASGECEFLRQLGEQVALAVRDAQLHGALWRAYDNLHKAQRTVAERERLSALGQMAIGIAHNVNNAISPVALYAQALLQTEAGLSENARGALKNIRRLSQDVLKTVTRIREFYREREPPLPSAPIYLNALAEEVIDFTRARWSDMPQGRGITIHMVTDFAPDLPEIMGVESEVREALINLIFNAVDAMPEGGTLTVRTWATQAQVRLEIHDTGIGMDEDTLRRCVEPFFTTKGEAGIGLGLAMVDDVAGRHGARIEIESEVGGGSSVSLVFSVPEQSAAGSDVPPRQRILVVGDDPMLLESLREILESDGHAVVAANGGQAGIEAFEEAQAHGDPFGVVITDWGMLHVDGRQVAATVKSAAPSTRVILLTGSGRRTAESADLATNADWVLDKPPTLHELRDALAHGRNRPVR
jgi:signal transduction histidine kinase/ActR/RegA family two-component response regulator